MTRERYIAPDKATLLFNRAVAWLTRRGVSVAGSRELAVKGRKSGKIQRVPVNLLPLEGHRYLVAPRGHTQWVKNLRVAGTGELRVGRRVEQFTATELPDQEKVPVIREYVRRWAWEVKSFLGDDVSKDSSDEQLLEVAPGFPVFRLN